MVWRVVSLLEPIQLFKCREPKHFLREGLCITWSVRHKTLGYIRWALEKDVGACDMPCFKRSKKPMVEARLWGDALRKSIVNFLERIMTSLDHLNNKLCRAHFLWFLKENIVANVLRSHPYSRNI